MRKLEGKRIICCVISIFVAIALWGCGNLTGEYPNEVLVARAIALQLNLNQTPLSQQLHLNTSPVFTIDRVAIAQQEFLKIQDLPSFHLRGTYDVTVVQSSRELKQQRQPFDLYLQRQKQGKTWRLARRELTQGAALWRTWLVP